MVLHSLSSFSLLATSPRLTQPTNADNTSELPNNATQFVSLATASNWQNSQHTQTTVHKHSTCPLLPWHNMFPNKGKHYSMHHFHSLTLALQHLLTPAFVSSSTTESFLLLHPIVHSSSSNHCIEVVLRLQHLPSLPSFPLRSSSMLVCLLFSQLHRWVGFSNPKRLTPLFDKLQLPLRIKSLLAPKLVDTKCIVPQVPMVGAHNWKHSHRRDSDPGGPNVYSKKEFYITDQEQH